MRRDAREKSVVANIFVTNDDATTLLRRRLARAAALAETLRNRHGPQESMMLRGTLVTVQRVFFRKVTEVTE
jgi:hypothetical protein